ncbi:MAG: hypothetical protein JSR54_16355, partial [Proteobacteria bacterium]|nr:hypothetical protein [Pseudomonadota bacterium]
GAAPAPAPAPARATAGADAARIAGHYESSRRVEHGFLSVFYLLQQTTLVANPDGTISAPRELEPGTATFREVDTDRWQEVDGTRRLALTSVDGVKTVVDSEDPTSVLQAVPLHRLAALNLSVLLGAFVTLLIVVLHWPLSWLLRRRHRVPPEAAPLARLRRRVRLVALGNLAWCAAWFAVLQPVLRLELEFYSSSLDPMIRALQVAGVLLVAADAYGLAGLLALARAFPGWGPRLRAALVAAALAGIVWIGWVGQLLSFDLNY